ncbi:uncharacterized protein LOC130987715 isoform X2 [Salvia miltiorrhiza]|uniref:uncharacterized protein LOC130987715 isoform X2 n=1 Tax=Salvia miltiorrhiza TaxID=226208 RepID=UPI0025AB7D87|nr:uncharacterized protein LOC130987715 isoform X2 [Salvia miltiorrhiza]
MWCDNCAKNVRTDNTEGKACCSLCGKVLAEDNFTEEVQFTKSSNGQARLQGSFVESVRGHSESHERTLTEAYYGIKNIMYALEIDGGDYIANVASKFYEAALGKNFTRGRRKEQVQAACLYITCSYVLGAVFLQLCKALNLGESDLLQNLVDPSLFIHRFADRLFKTRDRNVSKTALQIVASMKRDWMQSGRKPSGLCGAALYISALAHGLNCSKSEIIKTVHICEATLTKRLIEFENTESGGLTIEEFEKKSEELAAMEEKFGVDESQMKSRSGELLCRHKGEPQFAYGLCKDCYKAFMALSGGLNGGSEPPAFQRAERKRIMAEEAAADRSEDLDSSTLAGPTETNSKLLNSDEQRSLNNTIQDEVKQPAHPDSTGATLKSNTIHDTIDGRTDASDFTGEESESLSDIDDIEVDVYINTEEEKNLKTTVWEEMNREYLEEQEAKQAAAKKAYEPNFANCSGDVEGARQLAEAAAAAVAQNRKEKRQKRAAELKNLEPTATTKEVVEHMISTKSWSDKIRKDLLEDLIDLSPKKRSRKAETETEHDDDYLEEDLEPEDAYVNAEDYNYDQDINDMDDHF